MKFGAQLELYAIPEWQDKYIHYNVLKRFLTRGLAEAKVVVPSLSRRESTGSDAAPSAPLLAETTPADPIETLNKEFMSMLDSELTGVEQHFTFEMSFLLDRLTGVEEELKALALEESIESGDFNNDLNKSTTVPVGSAHSSTSVTPSAFIRPTHAGGHSSSEESTEREARSYPSSVEESTGLKGLVSTYREHRATKLRERKDKEKQKEIESRRKTRSAHRDRLRRAVVGIWDCLDKLEGFVQLNVVALYKILKKRDKTLGMKKISVDLPDKKRRLSLLIVQQSVKDALLRLYNTTSSEDETAAGLDMQSLSAMVQKHFVAARPPVSATWVPFFLGACFVIFFDILLAAILPPSNPSFSLATVLTLLPIFRLLFMIMLMAWGAGAVLFTFEFYGVNYKFILDIDPKCQVSAATLFSLASLLTVIWVIGFGTFLVDVKFGLFFSLHRLWIYPVIVLLCYLVVVCLPSRTFRYSYRKRILIIIGDTLCTGFRLRGKITLVNNIIGDIFTSLAKPLLDLQFTLLYFGGLYFLDESSVFTGVPVFDRFASPLLTLLPYWIRLVQCATRFRTETEMRKVHAANMGKYFSTIVVILTSNIAWENFGMSIYASRLIFVFVYIFASLYNFIWDITMDWGLMPDPDNFVRPDHRVMYPQWLYYFITFLNLVGRLTWALTLVPIGILDDYRFNVSMITLAISSIEIVRRSAWLVLRLENEHLTNSSRYRAMLWVPKMTPSHPDTNPLVQDGKAADTMLYQALKRFASIQVDSMPSQLANKSSDGLDTIPETPPKKSELFELLRASRASPSSASALVGLPPLSKLGSVMAAAEIKTMAANATNPTNPTSKPEEESAPSQPPTLLP